MRTANVVDILLSAVATSCLAGCQTQHPTESVVGDPPHEYERTAQEAVMGLPLFKAHPQMAQYLGCTKPVTAYQTSMPLQGGKVVWQGYTVEITYSVKNVFGISHVAYWHVLYNRNKVHALMG